MRATRRTPRAMRVVFVVSHPVQHFCPQYRSIAQREDVKLTVKFVRPACPAGLDQITLAPPLNELSHR